MSSVLDSAAREHARHISESAIAQQNQTLASLTPAEQKGFIIGAATTCLTLAKQALGIRDSLIINGAVGEEGQEVFTQIAARFKAIGEQQKAKYPEFFDGSEGERIVAECPSNGYLMGSLSGTWLDVIDGLSGDGDGYAYFINRNAGYGPYANVYRQKLPSGKFEYWCHVDKKWCESANGRSWRKEHLIPSDAAQAAAQIKTDKERLASRV